MVIDERMLQLLLLGRSWPELDLFDDAPWSLARAIRAKEACERHHAWRFHVMPVDADHPLDFNVARDCLVKEAEK